MAMQDIPQNAKRTTVGGAAPNPGLLVLDDPRASWMIQTGYFDVFAVEFGEHEGRRHHVMRAEPGDRLFGVEPTKSGYRLIAVGAIGAVIERARGADQKSDSAGNWIGSLSRAATGPVGDWPNRVAQPGQMRIAAAERLSADPRHLLWVEVKAGSLRLMDAGLVAAGSSVPLAGHAWLAADVPADVDVSERANFASKDLSQFNSIMLAAIATRLRHDQEAANDLYESSQGDLRRNFEATMDALSGIAKREQNFDSGGSNNALGGALMEILKAQGAAPDELTRARAAIAQMPVKGTEQERLSYIMHRLHLGQRRVVLRPDTLEDEGQPLLVFREPGNRPAALISRGVGGWDIKDAGKSGPAEAERGNISGSAVQVYPNLRPEKLSIADLLKFGGANLLPDFGRLAFAMAAVAVIGLLMPVWSYLLIDTVIPNGRINMLWSVVIVMVMTSLGSAAFEFSKSLALLRLSSRADSRLQPALMERLLRLPPRFYRQHTVGDIMDRTLGINAARQMLSGPVMNAVLGGIFGLFSLVPLFFYDARLAWISAGITAVICAVIAALCLGQLKHQRHEMRQKGRLEGFVVQLLVGVAKLRAAAAEQRAMSQWTKYFVAQRDCFVAVQRWQAAQTVMISVLPILGTIVLFAAISYFAGVAAIAGAADTPRLFSAAEFIAFSTAFTQVMLGLTTMTQALTQTLIVVPLLERAKPILETPIETSSEAELPGQLLGGIELKHVKFRYIPDGPVVTDDLSLKIEPGQFVALVGSSGSGKSTIARLILGFERPELGEIFFDSKSAERLDMAAVRRQIGVVLQNGRLSSGSIYENILGNSNLGLDEAWAAARLVGLDKDIEGMPMGMHTVILDGGGTLSGGQRQRILIARALVQKPRILLLDEATSALDNRTQSIVTETLGRLSTTRIVIAHRLTTIQAVDRIFVLDHGRLVESGSYDELMAKQGAFASLVKRQML